MSINLADQAEKNSDMVLKTSHPAVNGALHSMSESMHRGADTLRDTSRQLRDGAIRVSDNTVNYIRLEPIKSVAIAAAAGAGLVALIGLWNRSHPRA